MENATAQSHLRDFVQVTLSGAGSPSRDLPGPRLQSEVVVVASLPLFPILTVPSVGLLSRAFTLYDVCVVQLQVQQEALSQKELPWCPSPEKSLNALGSSLK